MTLVLAAVLTLTGGTALLARARGHADWAWLVIIFGPLGALAYLFLECLSPGRATGRVGQRAHGGPEVLATAEADALRIDSATVWTEYAAELRRHGKGRAAVDAARTAVARDPEDLHACYELGLCLRSGGQHAEAIEPLETVVGREPFHDTGEALYALADSCRQDGRLAAARGNFERLVERFSRGRFLLGLAMAQVATGDLPVARATLERAIADADQAPAFHRREAERWAGEAKKLLRQIE